MTNQPECTCSQDGFNGAGVDNYGCPLHDQPDSVEEFVEQLRPRVEWIPQSEQDYLQRQKLLPVFRGWLHQAWVAQKPHLIKAITQAKAEERERIRKEISDVWWNKDGSLKSHDISYIVSTPFHTVLKADNNQPLP